jgi:predicted permease
LVAGWSGGDVGIGGMTAAYGNLVLLGYPLVLAAYGDAGALPLFLLLATQSLVLFPLATWTIARGGRGSGARPRAASVVANPVIAALVLGLGASVSGWQAPAALDRLLSLLAAAGPGCALVALGVSLAQHRLRGGGRSVILLTVLKTLCCPLLVWSAGRLFGVERVWLEVAVLLAAMPVGINAFVFAGRYHAREAEVAKTIVTSTLVSMLVASALLWRFLG